LELAVELVHEELAALGRGGEGPSNGP
jgi:hypothetical protein